MDLRGKGVFLTGGANGLGRAFTEKLLYRKARVLFCDIYTVAGKAAECELQAKYGVNNVIFVKADVTDEEQLTDAFKEAVSKFGAVDICVNNAGIMDERIWDKMLAVNTVSHIRGSLLALEHMRMDRGGRGGVIINVVALAGLFPFSYCPAYSASKHAMIGFTRSWAISPEQPDHGVRWCCLCPQATDTEFMVFREDRIYMKDAIIKRNEEKGLLPVVEVVEAFMKLVLDPDNNGAILEVTKENGTRYRKRQMVDPDGVSNPILVDKCRDDKHLLRTFRKLTVVMDPQGKGVFLTGGAQGLGRGTVDKLLSLGAKVLFCDINVEKGRATEAELQEQYGVDVVFFHPADVSDDKQHKAAFQRAVSKFGTVDIYVNNAGIMNENTWEKMIAVNVGGYIRGSLQALEHMRRDRGGRGGVIINVASKAGLIPSLCFPSYVASKHAVVGFTTSWAMSPDQKDHGVRWCCLCPDPIDTSMIKNNNNIYHQELFEQYVKENGVMPVSQVAEVIIKLIRDPENNGAILEVSLRKGANYRRRQVVDRDGVSDLVVVDTY
ncbi:uncharacterized protein LOC112554400 [Pomacea canaliculata]|uniref:uncharacterized protein LOC112554400 n=1 Tax=Pomacea canaliculata TaxID=400727 RepID=UPI000D72DE68|nr:uncharacterized protein LOC112554400 [Pomacea canaliculata]